MNGDITRGGREEAAGRAGATGMTGTTDGLGEATGLAAAGVGIPGVGVAGAGAAGPDVAEVSGAVSQWVEQVGRFLGVLQAALEQSRPREDATAEVRALSGQLPALIRQCRAQVPTPDMIRTWVKTLRESHEVEPAPQSPLRPQALVNADCQA